MTFDKFKKDFMTFLTNSTVNLGRKQAKTRDKFLEIAMAKFDAFASSVVEDVNNHLNQADQKGKDVTDKDGSTSKKKTSNPMGGSVLCIKPTDPNKALDVGKGVHAMTPSESMRADEQLNRSPFAGKSKKKEKKNE